MRIRRYGWPTGCLVTPLIGIPFSVHSKNLGLGIILGSPTGISAKKIINKSNAIDGAISWSFGDNSSKP